MGFNSGFKGLKVNYDLKTHGLVKKLEKIIVVE